MIKYNTDNSWETKCPLTTEDFTCRGSADKPQTRGLSPSSPLCRLDTGSEILNIKVRIMKIYQPTHPNPGPAVSTDEMSHLAVVNLRGPGELLKTNLNNYDVSFINGRKGLTFLPDTQTSCP